jgi:hypothetical protein
MRAAIEVIPEEVAVTRDDAIAMGLTRFRDGRVCKRGHQGEWRVGNVWGGQCLECAREIDRRRIRSDPEKVKARLRVINWHRRHPEQRRAAWDRSNDKRRALRRIHFIIRKAR